MRATGTNRQVPLSNFAFDPTDRIDTVGALEMLGGGNATALPQSGVKRLMLAVLEDGIRCYFSPVPRIRAEAEHWIESGRRSAFSFEVVCDMFGLEPDAAREALRRLRGYESRPGMLRMRHRGTVRRAAVSIPC